jgi:hypothetical protein
VESTPALAEQMPSAHSDGIRATLTDASPLVQLADYSEGSMGPDIHPYPEGSEDALMVRASCVDTAHISAEFPPRNLPSGSRAPKLHSASAAFSVLGAQCPHPCSRRGQDVSTSNTKFMSAPAAGTCIIWE